MPLFPHLAHRIFGARSPCIAYASEPSLSFRASRLRFCWFLHAGPRQQAVTAISQSINNCTVQPEIANSQSVRNTVLRRRLGQAVEWELWIMALRGALKKALRAIRGREFPPPLHEGTAASGGYSSQSPFRPPVGQKTLRSSLRGRRPLGPPA
jgi:hypothetical protein